MFEEPSNHSIQEMNVLNEEHYETEMDLRRESFATTSMLMDTRIIWIRDKACTFLGLPQSRHLFNDLINKNDRYFEDQLLNFMVLDLYGVTDLTKKQVFFYKTYNKEVVQEEVVVWTESQRTNITAISSKTKPQRLTKSAPGKVEKVEEDKKEKREKKSKKGKKAKGGKSDIGLKTDLSSSIAVSTIDSSRMDIQPNSELQVSDAQEEVRSGSEEGEGEDEDEGEEGGWKDPKPKTQTKTSVSMESMPFVPAPGEESNYIMSKQMVDKVVQVPEIHMFFGEIDGNRTDLFDKNLVYFLRTNEAGVPPFESAQECKAEIPDYIAVGSLNGRYLSAMDRLLVHVFKPLVQRQFREPSAPTRKEEPEAVESQIGELAKKTRKLSAMKSPQSAVFSRPSEYRRMSVAAKKAEGEAEEEKEKAPAESSKQETSPPEPAKEASTTKPEKSKERKSLAALKSFSRKRKESKASSTDTRSVMSVSSAFIDVKSDKDVTEEKEKIEPTKKELLDSIDRLTTSIQWTLEHTEGDILLHIPKIPDLTDPQVTDEMFCANRKAMDQLDDVVISWGRHIQKVIDGFLNKVPLGKGPIAEYTYWHDRETGMSMLVEQLKTPVVKRILSLLNQVLSLASSSFDYYQIDLRKYYSQARDNVKFLFTILRHCKLISESDSFELITETIPVLMDGLKMIWVLSRYYCTDDKMVPLLERIGWQLCQNVKKNLMVGKLFEQPLNYVMKKTNEAFSMLSQWKTSYMNTREDIELSGKGTRWEFDKRRLFKETDYIAGVCSDLNKVASVLQDFYNIFGAELKAIINDPAQIDAVIKRVDMLVIPIQQADFDLYTEFNKENWEAMMNWFYAEVASLENEAKFFIDECFTVLISAEDALGTLLKFKGIKTRAAIQQQLLKKFEVIMQQFSKEIGYVENIFNRGKRNPPLLRYHPPMAGAIFWERQLFHRLKGPVLIFQNIKELKHSELKILAFGQYLGIAKQMKHFEESKFNMWVEKAYPTIAQTLKKSVLKMAPYDREKIVQIRKAVEPRSLGIGILTKGNKSGIAVHQQTPTGSVQRNDATISKQSSEAHSSAHGSKGISSKIMALLRLGKPDPAATNKERISTVSTISEKLMTIGQTPTWKEMMQGAILVDFQLRFEINFNWEVFDIIREAELLEHLGFELPTIIRDAGVQKDRLQSDIEVTEHMVNKFNGIVDQLNTADIQMLKSTLQNIEKHIQPGVTRLNWYSLGIQDYAAVCGKLLKNLVSIIEQVNQLKNDLHRRIVGEIETYNLFTNRSSPSEDSYILPSCKVYFLDVETVRTELICAMLKSYTSLGPMLMKLESLVIGTSTCRSPALQLHYKEVEYRVFEAFITCVVRNLDVLSKILTDSKAVFQVDAILAASEVVLRPSPGEVYNIILHDVKDLMGRMKVFPRWMAGSCLECKPTKHPNSEGFESFSFFEDIMSIQLVNDMIIVVQDTAHRLAVDQWKYLQRWKKYGNLWSFDKQQTCERFAAMNPTLLQYDDKFTFYAALVQEVEEMVPYYDINSLRVNLSPLLKGIKDHGNEWKQVLGSQLLGDTLNSMNDFKIKIENFRKDVELVINGLDRFKLVMQTIADIKKMSVHAEVQYLEYQETFRMLRLHEIAFTDEDEELSYKIQQEWESLYLGALYRATTLESTKDRFCQMTKEQIYDFGTELLEFAENFEKNGPGSVGDDLDSGMKKMDEYGKLIDMMDAKRLDLVNAEILFDLPLADYGQFLKVKKDYEGMELLYKLYKAQKTARDGWAKTLWANLNPQLLIDGMEQFMKEFRRLPKAVRTLNVGVALDTMMKGFRNSVPLFVELKNEAMRERHWMELMDKTGKHFDMSPERFGEQ